MESLPASVLIIEGYPLLRVALCNAVAAEPDLQIAMVDLDDLLTLEIPGMEDVLLVPNKLDLVLLSLGNPGLRELNALRVLHHARPQIPILVLTSNEVPGQDQAALEGRCAGNSEQERFSGRNYSSPACDGQEVFNSLSFRYSIAGGNENTIQ